MLNRRRILSFLGLAPAAMLPADVQASPNVVVNPLDVMSFDELRYLWNEHRSVADSCRKKIAAMPIRKPEHAAMLAAELKRHVERSTVIYKFAMDKFKINPRKFYLDFLVERDWGPEPENSIFYPKEQSQPAVLGDWDWPKHLQKT